MKRFGAPLSMLVLSCLFLIGAGCPIEIKAPSVDELGKNLVKSATAIANVDPLDLKRLASENKELRDQLLKINANLPITLGSGTLDLGKVAAKVRLKSYTGSHRISGWIDSRTGINIWSNKTIDDKKIKLEFKLYDALLEAYKNKPCTFFDCWFSYMSQQGEKRVVKVFEEFLEKSIVPPGTALDSPFLNPSLGKSGLHRLEFEITPLAVDDGGNWSVLLQTVAIGDTGTLEVISELQVDNKLYPSHKLGTPLPLVQMMVNITSSKPDSPTPN